MYSQVTPEISGYFFDINHAGIFHYAGDIDARNSYLWIFQSDGNGYISSSALSLDLRQDRHTYIRQAGAPL